MSCLSGNVFYLFITGLQVYFHRLRNNDRYTIMDSGVETVSNDSLKCQPVQVSAQRAKKHEIARLARFIHKDGEHDLAVHLFLALAGGDWSQIGRKKLWGRHSWANGIDLYTGWL